MGDERYDSTALLATHIDPSWSGPDEFQEVVEQYIDEEDYDDFVYVSAPGYFDGDYEDVADEVIESQSGGLDAFDADRLLHRYDAFTHIGAYWGACHHATFEDLVQRIDERDDAYRIDVPLDAVTDVEDMVLDQVRELSDQRVLVSLEDMEDGLHAVGIGYTRYMKTVESVSAGVDVSFDRIPVPTLSWTFNRRDE